MDILLVEHDFQHGLRLQSFLARDGLQSRLVKQPHEARTQLSSWPVQIMLLHTSMNHHDESIELIRFCREYHPAVGIIMLSHKFSPQDRTLGLELGADDYLDSETNVHELMARIKRLLERLKISRRSMEKMVRFSGFTMDRHDRQVYWGATGERVPLTARDYDLLSCLMETPNQTVDRFHLSIKVCGRPWQAMDRSIDVSISNLRKKLLRYNTRDTLIRSIRGKGYCLIVHQD